MKSKRFLSLALSGVMAMSLTVPALATNTETEITGTYQAPTIAVTVPTTGTAFINPYGLDMKLNDGATGAQDSKIVGQKIVTAPMFISNESEMNLKVGATVTGTPTTGVTFATESAANATAKSIYAYLQAERATSLTGAAATALSAANKAAAFTAWAAEAYDEDTDILVSASATTGTDLVTLKAATVTPGATPTVTYNRGSIAMVRLSGDCPANPREAWNAGDNSVTPAVPADGFTVNVAYTFTPVAAETYTLKLAAATNMASVKVNGQTVTASDLVSTGIQVDRELDAVIEVTPVSGNTCPGSATASDGTNAVTVTNPGTAPAASAAAEYTIAAETVAKDKTVTVTITVA